MSLTQTDKFTFFYGSKSPFSNFYRCSFQVDGLKFSCSEQCMMYGKAKLFKDHVIAQKILAETNPVKMKALGRKVKAFDAGVWARHREAIVHRALTAKFGQNEQLKRQLLDTGPGTLLAEASPRDRIWGIGMGASNPLALDKANWKGLNLLGKILTRVRGELNTDEAKS